MNIFIPHVHIISGYFTPSKLNKKTSALMDD